MARGRVYDSAKEHKREGRATMYRCRVDRTVVLLDYSEYACEAAGAHVKFGVCPPSVRARRLHVRVWGETGTSCSDFSTHSVTGLRASVICSPENR